MGCKYMKNKKNKRESEINTCNSCKNYVKATNFCKYYELEMDSGTIACREHFSNGKGLPLKEQDNMHRLRQYMRELEWDNAINNS